MLEAGALGRPRGMVWGGRREKGSGWGAHVYLWRIRFDVWQILSFLKGAIIELLKHLLSPHQCTSYSFGEWCVLWVFPKGLTKQTSADRDRLTLLFFSICSFLMESGLEFLKLCYVGK